MAKSKLKEIVEIINTVLETTWTTAEWELGKEIDVPRDWHGRVQIVLPEYRKAGWSVARKVEIISTSPGLPRDYLIFKAPKAFEKQPKEIRSVGLI